MWQHFHNFDTWRRATNESFRPSQQRTAKNQIHNGKGTQQSTTVYRCNNSDKRKNLGQQKNTLVLDQKHL